jgi:hypothetical protein
MEEENVPKLDKGVEKKRLISCKLLKEIKKITFLWIFS